MRSFAAALVCVVIVVGCSSKSITSDCTTGSRTGTAPHCILLAECLGTHAGLGLDCSGSDGNCICSENDIVGKTVPYDDAFCSDGDSNDFSTLEASLETANAACGWGY